MKEHKNKIEYNYRGFNLKSITWGYRDIFKNAIDNLFDEKLLGKENRDSTRIFFDLLKKGSESDSYCYGHVLKNFLVSLNSQNNWILKIPSILSDWTSLGYEFSEYKIFMGLSYFEIWGKGGFGNTPEEVSYVLNKARELKLYDMEFSYTFIESYKKLSNHLNNDEINVFVENALVLLNRNRKNALLFLKMETKTSLVYVQSISREVRLQDIKSRLLNYAVSISGKDIKLNNLGELDSDDLIDRGSMVVVLDEWFYFPGKVSFYNTKEDNINFYLLLSITTSSCHYFKSFPVVHGLKQAGTSLEFIRNRGIKNPELINNYFIIFETYRILFKMLKTFPGILPLFKYVVRKEICARKEFQNPFDELLKDSLKNLAGYKTKKENSLLIKDMRLAAGKCSTFLDTIKLILKSDDLIKSLVTSANTYTVFALSFFPDFMYPGTISDAPEQDLFNKLNDFQQKLENSESVEEDNSEKLSEISENSDKGDNSDTDSDMGPIGYFYDEWNRIADDYLKDWCCLREKRPKYLSEYNLDSEYSNLSMEVKKVFEKLKPEQIKKEKFLPEGDNIDIDRLIEHISLRKAKVIEEERFYEKPFINKRDLSVAILIDLSGSTGEAVEGNKKVIDMEKESAYILAEGLSEIGDTFGIFGFTGSGRENAEYYIFKDFEEKWEDKTKRGLFSATPASSTRIGVALRHTGCKISSLPAKKKLIIIITDGKPMDSHYEHTNRYAQFDVRKANEENLKKGISSFCISTEENKIEDLEIMFPLNHYVIIKSMKDLPKVLSRFYLKLTT